MTLSVLVVDDDIGTRATLVEFFEALGHTARGAGTGEEARRLAAEHAPDVVLLDLRLPDADGMTVLEALRADDPDVAVILLTGYADVRVAVRAMQQGAADVLEKPIDLDALQETVRRAGRQGRLRQELALLRARDRGREAGGEREAAASESDRVTTPSVDEFIELAARNPDAPVLLQGETGTGKGWVARRIHDRSARRDAPFVEINCASLTPTFFESELFGHERGAFTDARQAKRGLLEVAAGGTLFLDEVADMALEAQPKLLKVIEEHTFRRLGGTCTLRSTARVIVATHEPLERAVADRRFRADLYYRLQVLTLTLPPLRTRRGAISPLADELLPRGATLSAEAREALGAYDWPGNVRELRNALWRASILADGAPISPAHLGLGRSGAAPVADDQVLTLADAERRAIAAALHANDGNRTKAAAQLGIARSTLLEKLRRHPDLAGIRAPGSRSA